MVSSQTNFSNKPLHPSTQHPRSDKTDCKITDDTNNYMQLDPPFTIDNERKREKKDMKQQFVSGAS